MVFYLTKQYPQELSFSCYHQPWRQSGPKINSSWITNQNEGEGEEAVARSKRKGEGSVFLYQNEGEGEEERRRRKKRLGLKGRKKDPCFYM